MTDEELTAIEEVILRAQQSSGMADEHDVAMIHAPALLAEVRSLRAERGTLRSRLARSKAKTRRYFGMLKWQLQELRRDHARLDWLSDSAQFEAIGIDDVGEAGGCVGLDMYEHASIVAAERGNEGDLTDSDLRKGFRRMIDAAMAVQP